jgi:hypothetical protein
MEACAAHVTVHNAGEVNGVLKPKMRLFGEPLIFARGDLLMPRDFLPSVDRDRKIQVASERFTPTVVAAAGLEQFSGATKRPVRG